MTLIIVIILILSYLLIATSNLTKVNKTAIAIFAAAVGGCFIYASEPTS